jgi:hypothetical protein
MGDDELSAIVWHSRSGGSGRVTRDPEIASHYSVLLQSVPAEAGSNYEEGRVLA